MERKLMKMNKVGPADRLPAEVPVVSGPSMKSTPTKKAKTKWFSALCCAGVQEAVSQGLNTLPCARRGGETSTSGAGSAVLTEEQWLELRSTLAFSITKEEFLEVLDKISGWVKVAVKDVVVPALESGLALRSSGRISISSSSLEVELGEISPSQVIYTQRQVERKSSNCSSSLVLRSASPYRYVDAKPEAWRNSRTSLREPLGALFGITQDRIFSGIHREVTRSMQNTLPLKIKNYLSTKATLSLTTTILDDTLKNLNSSLAEIYQSADLYQGVFLTGSTTEDVAQNLLLVVFTQMQDFVQLCTLSDWLSGTRGSQINIHEELEEMLPSVSTTAVGAVVENMLSICSEGTSSDFNEYGLDRPLWHFLRAVSDKINSATTEQATCGSVSSMEKESLIQLCSVYPEIVSLETPSQSRRSPTGGVQDLYTQLTATDTKYTEITSSLIYQSLLLQEYINPRPRCERILERIIFSCPNEHYNWGTDTNEMNTQELFRMSCDAFQLEASERVGNIIMNETAEFTKVSDALETQDPSSSNTDMSTSQVSIAKLKSSAFASAVSVVRELTCAFKRTVEEDLDLETAQPSTDPKRYKSQVQLVSEKVLRSIQEKLKEGLVTNLLIRADAAMPTQYGADLGYKLLVSSKNIVKNIIESIVSQLPCSDINNSRGMMAKEFLQSLNENVEILHLRQLLTPGAIHLEALSYVIIVDVFERIAEKVICSGDLEQMESGSLKSLDRILSKDSLKQSSHELIPVVGSLMQERIAALDRVKAQTDRGVAQSVLSAPDLSNETVHSGVVSSFVKTATENLLQHSLSLMSHCEHQCSGSTSFMLGSDSEVQRSVEQCSSEVSTAVARTVISELAGISAHQSKQECTSSALHSSAQQVDVGLERQSFKQRFRLPKFLKFKFKQRKTKLSVSTEGRMLEKHIPHDEPSSSPRTIPKAKRKSLFNRITTALSKLCGK